MSDAAKLASMTNAELVALYNSMVTKKIKKFSSRSVGEKRVRELLAAQPGTPGTKRINKTSKQPGRPPNGRNYSVSPAQGKTKLHPLSERGKVMAFLHASPSHPVSVAALSEKFGKRVKGVLNKLSAVGWVKLRPEAAA